MFKRALPWSQDKPARNELDQPEQEVLISGSKIILREKRIEDAADDYAWRTDEELARLDATRPLHMRYEDFTRYSKEEISYPNPRSKRLAIDTLDGKHIGNCMFYDIDLDQGGAELGIMIGDREYWSKGYGTDTVDSLLSHIFTTTSLSRIYLHTLDWNQRALRSFSKSGFQAVKNVRRSGFDFILMEVHQSDWERRSSPDNGASEIGSPTEQS